MSPLLYRKYLHTFPLGVAWEGWCASCWSKGTSMLSAFLGCDSTLFFRGWCAGEDLGWCLATILTSPLELVFLTYNVSTTVPFCLLNWFLGIGWVGGGGSGRRLERMKKQTNKQTTMITWYNSHDHMTRVSYPTERLVVINVILYLQISPAKVTSSHWGLFPGQGVNICTMYRMKNKTKQLPKRRVCMGKKASPSYCKDNENNKESLGNKSEGRTQKCF